MRQEFFTERDRRWRGAERSIGLRSEPKQPKAISAPATKVVLATAMGAFLWAGFLASVGEGWGAAAWAFNVLCIMAGG